MRGAKALERMAELAGGDLASRESLSDWKEMLAGLRQALLHEVEFVVSDDHADLRRAIPETLLEPVWQRCAVTQNRNEQRTSARHPGIPAAKREGIEMNSSGSAASM